jgi:citrate lyase beta subunit
MRSKLFVPASRPELFAKALASEADAISIDLEDAVHESRKAQARAAVTEFLESAALATTARVVIVRVNALATAHFDADLNAVVRPRLDILNLPKAESADDVRAAAAALVRYESGRGIERPIGILANIESPRGLRRAAEIASADARVVGLQLGLGDLFEPLGMDRQDATTVHYVQLAVRLAAADAGIPAYDTAFATVSDLDGYRKEAQRAHRLGYAGKSCIHPSQIPIANEVFRPSDEEIARAVRVVNAWREAETKGIAVLTVDGKMIDLPFAQRAQAIVAFARRLGLGGPR